MKQREALIVGEDVADQQALRDPVRVRDLDQFLEFLARLEAVFGRTERRRELTTGERFLL